MPVPGFSSQDVLRQIPAGDEAARAAFSNFFLMYEYASGTGPIDDEEKPISEEDRCNVGRPALDPLGFVDLNQPSISSETEGAGTDKQPLLEDGQLLSELGSAIVSVGEDEINDEERAETQGGTEGKDEGAREQPNANNSVVEGQDVEKEKQRVIEIQVIVPGRRRDAGHYNFA